MKLKLLLALLLVLQPVGVVHAQQTARPTKPVLINREEILAERDRIAERLLARGDSLYIKVFAHIDNRGVLTWPEIKTPSGNPRADSAAIALVRKMKFKPAGNAPKGVLMTIPVMLVRRR